MADQNLDRRRDTAGTQIQASPAALRSMLSDNLRRLVAREPSVSALCRELGINRTQFNRYLSGESFPRPDLLHRICTHFAVDARILLEPLDRIDDGAPDLFGHPFMADFVGAGLDVPEADFPGGFYRFVRRSFLDESLFVRGLVHVHRQDGRCFLRGFEAREAMRNQGLPETPATREFRGAVLPQEEGVSILVSRRGATTASFNYLARIPSFENNLWTGYTVRAVREAVAGRRAERLVYEHLGRDPKRVLAAARSSGFCSESDLTVYHRKLLDPSRPFD